MGPTAGEEPTESSSPQATTSNLEPANKSDSSLSLMLGGDDVQSTTNEGDLTNFEELFYGPEFSADPLRAHFDFNGENIFVSFTQKELEEYVTKLCTEKKDDRNIPFHIAESLRTLASPLVHVETRNEKSQYVLSAFTLRPFVFETSGTDDFKKRASILDKSASGILHQTPFGDQRIPNSAYGGVDLNLEHLSHSIPNTRKVLEREFRRPSERLLHLYEQMAPLSDTKAHLEVATMKMKNFLSSPEITSPGPGIPVSARGESVFSGRKEDEESVDLESVQLTNDVDEDEEVKTSTSPTLMPTSASGPMLSSSKRGGLEQKSSVRSNPGDVNLLLQPLRLSFEICDKLAGGDVIEPFFCSVALYDVISKTKMSETFYFDVNPQSVIKEFGIPEPDSSEFSLKQALFTIRYKDISAYQTRARVSSARASTNMTNGHIYFIFKVYKILQGEFDAHVAMYLKPEKAKTDRNLLAHTKETVRRHGEVRQLFAYTFFSVQSFLTATKGDRNSHSSLSRQGVPKDAPPASGTFNADGFFYVSKSLTDEQLLDSVLNKIRKFEREKEREIRSQQSLSKSQLQQAQQSPPNDTASTDSDTSQSVPSPTPYRPKKMIPGKLFFNLTRLDSDVPLGEKVVISFDSEKRRFMSPLQEKLLDLGMLRIRDEAGSEKLAKQIKPFPIVQDSLTIVNDLYICPIKVNFSTKFWEHRSVMLTIRLMANDDVQSGGIPCFYQKRQCPYPLANEFKTAVTFHEKETVFSEEAKLVLPSGGLTEKHHLLFVFEHISCNVKKPRSKELIGLGFFRLQNESGSKEHSNSFEICVWNKLPPRGYLNEHSYSSSQQSMNDFKKLDGGKAVLSFRLKYSSTFYPDDDHLYRFFTTLDKKIEELRSSTAPTSQSPEQTDQVSETSSANNTKSPRVRVHSTVSSSQGFVRRIRQLVNIDHAYIDQYLPLLMNILFQLIRDFPDDDVKSSSLKTLILLVKKISLDRDGEANALLPLGNGDSGPSAFDLAKFGSMYVQQGHNHCDHKFVGYQRIQQYLIWNFQFNDIHEVLTCSWLQLINDLIAATKGPAPSDDGNLRSTASDSATPTIAVSVPGRSVSTSQGSVLSLASPISEVPRFTATSSGTQRLGLQQDFDSSKLTDILFKYSRFLFSCIIKSMILHIHGRGLLKNDRVVDGSRTGWFPESFLTSVEGLIKTTADFVVANSVSRKQMVLDLNNEVASFLQTLLRIMDRGYGMHIARQYILQMFRFSSSENGDQKFHNSWVPVFLNLYMNYENLLSLCLPNQTVIGEINTLRNRLVRGCGFNQIVIENYANSIRQFDDDLRKLAVLVVRDMILREALDARFQNNAVKQRFADLNFGFFLIFLDTFEAWRESSEKKCSLVKLSIEKTKNLFDKIDSQITANLEQSKRIDEELVEMKNIGDSKIAFAAKNKEKEHLEQILRNLLNEKVLRKNSIAASEKNLAEELERLNIEQRQVAACMLHILTNMDRAKLREWWTKEAPVNKSAFITTLLLFLETFSCKLKNSMQFDEEVSKVMEELSRPEPTLKNGDPKSFSFVTSVSSLSSEDSDADQMSQEELDKKAQIKRNVLEANICAEVSFIVLDILIDFVDDNEKELKAISVATNMASAPTGQQQSIRLITLMDRVFELVVGFLRTNQSTANLLCFLEFLGVFLERFSEVLFSSNNRFAKFSESICEELLWLCNSKTESVRALATAILYLYIRKHFENLKNFSLLKISLTQSVSKLIPKMEDMTQFRKSIEGTSFYAQKDPYGPHKSGQGGNRPLASPRPGSDSRQQRSVPPTSPSNLTSPTSRTRSDTFRGALSFFKKIEVEERILTLAEENNILFFRENVQDLCRRLVKLLEHIFEVREHERMGTDPETISDFYYEISQSYQHTPELRMIWLDKLTEYHFKLLNFAEAAQCIMKNVILVCEYLRPHDSLVRRHLPTHLLKRVCPSMSETEIPEEIRSLLLENVSLSHSKHFTRAGLMELLQRAATLFEKAEQHELTIEVHKMLIPFYERVRDYPELSRTHFHVHELYDIISNETASNTRVFGTYYRVGFFGPKFAELDGREFVYKTHRITRIMEISEMLETSFKRRFGPTVRILGSTVDPQKALAETSDGLFIQITNVKPFFTKEQLEARETHIERNISLDRFLLEAPFQKGSDKSQAQEVKDQWKRKIILTVEQPFPFVKKRALIVSRQEIILSPIENSIELLSHKNERLSDMLSDIAKKRIDLNSISLTLQGSVRVTVNAGSQEIARSFLTNPAENEPLLVIALYECCKRFLYLCGELLKVHGSLVRESKLAFHQSLEEGYQELQQFYAPYFKKVEVEWVPTLSAEIQQRFAMITAPQTQSPAAAASSSSSSSQQQQQRDEKFDEKSPQPREDADFDALVAPTAQTPNRNGSETGSPTPGTPSTNPTTPRRTATSVANRSAAISRTNSIASNTPTNAKK